jgi:hypothetical protein
MQIFPCGTEIKTKLGEIDGLITAALVRSERVSYEITYFNQVENGFTTTWMFDFEFTTNAEKVEKKGIGFK